MVKNDVFVFIAKVNLDKSICVYVKPDKYTEEEVENCYFTKNKIQELKDYFIKKIQESENPFTIYCSDIDGDHNITEKELFDMKK